MYPCYDGTLMGCNEQHHIITQHLYSTVALIHKLADLLILCSLEPSEHLYELLLLSWSLQCSVGQGKTPGFFRVQ
jgi:hypothetical protein